MTQALKIVMADDHIPRIDSRLVAKSLSIEHESFMRTLHTYQAELGELGILRFEIGEIKGRGQPERYTLLNEDQAIFAATLSRNTRQVVAFKLQLTKAFSQARRQLQEQQQPSTRTLKEALRERLSANEQNIPAGYFTPGSVASRHMEALMDMLSGLDASAMPERSIAQRFARYATEELHIPDEHRRKYSHVLANGRVVWAWAYDRHYIPLFVQWLWTVYFPQHFPDYARYRARSIGLPAPKPRKRLPAHTPHFQVIQQPFAW